jgi:membrane-associated protease RseP (regulator of RpoE activity)
VDASSRHAVHGATIALDALTTTAANAIPAAQSDPNGAYTLDGAPPGPFSIRVSHPSYQTRILAGLMTRGSSTLQQDIELHALVDGGPREEYMGIGAVLSPSPKGVVVASVVAEGPAERAGLQVGDRIVRIDGADATASPMTECIQALRGAEGSIVTVRVERDGRDTEMSIPRRLFSR